jgi:hypothetical protein
VGREEWRKNIFSRLKGLKDEKWFLPYGCEQAKNLERWGIPG